LKEDEGKEEEEEKEDEAYIGGGCIGEGSDHN